MIGSRLSNYEVTAHLGSGGMGEVYQASDVKLGRSVAIKVLPEAFARDPERVARFGREARVLASLNHPNIAAIYGLEESSGQNFLVMELSAATRWRQELRAARFLWMKLSQSRSRFSKRSKQHTKRESFIET